MVENIQAYLRRWRRAQIDVSVTAKCDGGASPALAEGRAAYKRTHYLPAAIVNYKTKTPTPYKGPDARERTQSASPYAARRKRRSSLFPRSRPPLKNPIVQYVHLLRHQRRDVPGSQGQGVLRQRRVRAAPQSGDYCCGGRGATISAIAGNNCKQRPLAALATCSGRLGCTTATDVTDRATMSA
ncbi:hypothetical protein EVAR_7627_1 [Eumeta japonica]|uniref:Uncharacterized protein n=1 Tax=Eumeta variegata TaxID=151549 RepID=A0A4C1TJ22_EUMVA|nr:hypothetical protein EVAR_7627_1 [Eumeta japonica]